MAAQDLAGVSPIPCASPRRSASPPSDALAFPFDASQFFAAVTDTLPHVPLRVVRRLCADMLEAYSVGMVASVYPTVRRLAWHLVPPATPFYALRELVVALRERRPLPPPEKAATALLLSFTVEPDADSGLHGGEFECLLMFDVEAFPLRAPQLAILPPNGRVPHEQFFSQMQGIWSTGATIAAALAAACSVLEEPPQFPVFPATTPGESEDAVLVELSRRYCSGGADWVRDMQLQLQAGSVAGARALLTTMSAHGGGDEGGGGGDEEEGDDGGSGGDEGGGGGDEEEGDEGGGGGDEEEGDHGDKEEGKVAPGQDAEAGSAPTPATAAYDAALEASTAWV